MVSPRVLAAATRCQLLTGSYSGSSRNCPCSSPQNCVIPVEERTRLRSHPDVIVAYERNKKEFEETNE